MVMDIKTYVREKNVKTAEKILRKGKGAWGDFVNNALAKESTKIDKKTQAKIDRITQEEMSKPHPFKDYEKSKEGK